MSAEAKSKAKAMKKLYDLVRPVAEKEPDIKICYRLGWAKLRARPKLYAEVQAAMIDAAMWDVIYDLRHRQKQASIRGELRLQDPIDRGALDESLQACVGISFELKMANGRLLGDVDGIYLLECVEQEWGFTIGHERKARFYTALGEHCGVQKVREALSLQELKRLWRECARAAEQAVAERAATATPKVAKRGARNGRPRKKKVG